MPFFIPSRLVEFEYLGGNYEEDLEYENMAKDYLNEIDFAFFVTNFNYSKRDYLDLTPKERAFIMKAWETKLVSDTTHMRNAILNAIGNANRKKNAKFVDLWSKVRSKLDIEVAEHNLNIVQKIEEEDNDKEWIKRIYEANGMLKRK